MNAKSPRLKHWQFTCLCMTLVIIDQQLQYEQFWTVLEAVEALDAFTVITYLQLKSEQGENRFRRTLLTGCHALLFCDWKKIKQIFLKSVLNKSTGTYCLCTMHALPICSITVESLICDFCSEVTGLFGNSGIGFFRNAHGALWLYKRFALLEVTSAGGGQGCGLTRLLKALLAMGAEVYNKC